MIPLASKSHLVKTLTPGFLAAMARNKTGVEDTLALLKRDQHLSAETKAALDVIASDLCANPAVMSRDREIRSGQ